MIEVAGTWELGWSSPISEIEHWGMAMRSFGVTKLNMVPVSGTSNNLLEEYDTIEELLAAKIAEGLTPVFVDETADTELADFVHPENALYIFGNASYAPMSTHGEGRPSVRIDCSLLGMMWPHQAMCVVMRDRDLKSA